jgi:hypothetical protein
MITNEERSKIWRNAFPTTLAEIVPKGGLVNVYAEYRGQRYYLGSDPTISGAHSIAEIYKREYGPKVAVYYTDKADSTSINGAWRELQEAFERGAT